MISLAVAELLRYPEAQLAFYNKDTNVLVLAVADYHHPRYPYIHYVMNSQGSENDYDKLCKHTSIAMVSDMKEVWPIWRALGGDKLTALPVFHTFTRSTV